MNNIRKEIKRIKSGPQSGWFTLIHHRGPVIEHSNNIMERVDYILKHKDGDEHLVRLQHIFPVPGDMAEKYEKVEALAWKQFKKDRTSAWKEGKVEIPVWGKYKRVVASAQKPFLALIPNCKWDGKRIVF